MARKQHPAVGVIGLGIIGSRAAAGLRAAGFQVFVWNRTPRPAPNFLGSPADIARVAKIIQLFVADAQAVYDVINAMSEVLTPEHILICSATIGRDATLKAAALVEARGAKFLDAPFTGSKGASENRQLVYYVGGDEATFLRARPMLEATSKAIVPIGKMGDAAVVKIVTNMIAAASIQALSEALALVRAAGLDPEALSVALEQNACRSGTMDLKLPKMISGDFEPHFSLKHMFKDVQIGIHMANKLGVEIPAATVTAGVMFGALSHGHADLDFASIFKVYDPLFAKQQETAAAAAIEPEAHAAAAESDALEVVETVPSSAKPTETMPPETPASTASDEPPSKPFNRIRRFFSAQ